MAVLAPEGTTNAPGIAVLDDVGTDRDQPWLVLLWDDPVNLTGYVTRALQAVFGYSREKAAQLMLEAHTRGKAVCWSGGREQAEAYATELHTWSLNATVTQDR